jgi:hypothetical protein
VDGGGRETGRGVEVKWAEGVLDSGCETAGGPDRKIFETAAGPDRKIFYFQQKVVGKRKADHHMLVVYVCTYANHIIIT